MPGFMHFLDLHQRLQRWNRDGKHSSEGVEVQKVKPSKPTTTKNECDSLVNEAKALVEDKNAKGANKISSKTPMRSNIFKRRRRGQDQKRKISPLTSRLLRTISIHHLQCNDYAPPDESNPNKDSSSAGVRSNDANFLANRLNAPLLAEVPDGRTPGTRCEVCGTANSRHFVNHHNQLDELGSYLMETQMILREELKEVKEVLRKQEDRNATVSVDGVAILSEDLLQMVELLNANKELILKVLQDPSIVIANYAQDQPDSNSETFRVAGPSGEENGELLQPCVNLEASTVITIENGEVDGTKNEATSFANMAETAPASHEVKKQSKDGIAVNRFKAIKKRIKDVIKDTSKEHYRISMDRLLHRIPYGHRMSQSMKREALTSRERCISERFITGDGSSFSPANKSLNKTIKRSRSLTESLDKYSGLLESISSREPKRVLERPQPIKVESNLQSMRSGSNLERIFSLPDFDSSYTTSSEESDKLKPVYASSVEGDELAECIMDADDDQLAILGEMELPVFFNEQEQVSRDSAVEVGAHFQEVMVQPDIHATLFRTVVAGSEMRQRRTHLEKPDSFTILQSQLVADASDNEEAVAEADYYEVQSPMELTDLNTRCIRVNQRDEAEFMYARDTMRKFGLIGEDIPPDFLLLSELEGTRDGSGTEISIGEELLFDLINEAIAEIYDNSIACFPRFLHSVPRVRAKPTGYHLLQEVWANISWLLSSQMRTEEAVESVVARHYARNDGWMSLQDDMGIVGLELEDLICDDLLEEAINQFSDTSSDFYVP